MADLPEGFVLKQQESPPPEGFVLVPEPQPSPPPPGFTLKPEDYEPSVIDRFMEGTAVGRIIGALGQGMKDGWGANHEGLYEESERAFKDLGLYRGMEAGWTDSLRLFNEAILRPATAALDILGRATSAAVTGVAEAGGQIAQEFGMEPAEANRLVRDLRMLGESALIVSGQPTVPRVPRRALGAEATKTEAPASAEGTLAQRPFETAAPEPPSPAAVAPEPPSPVAAVPEQPPAPKPAPEAPTQLFDKADDGVIDRAGNINLDRIAAPEDVKAVIREAAEKGEGFAEARRTPMTFEQTRELADAIGMTPEMLLNRKVGQAFNAEEALAARNLLVQSATSVRELAVKAAGGTDADVLAFQQAMTRHMAIQEQVAGMTAEAGRALASFKIAAGEAKAVTDTIARMGGRERIEEVARMVADLETPQQLSKFALEARKATTGEMLIEAWINGLLSGPQTHVTNFISNTLVATISAPETALAAVIGKVRQAAGNTGERVLPGEAAQRLFGMVQGAKEGVRAGWRAFRTETPTDLVSKMDTPKLRAIPSATVEIGGRQIEVGGKQVRIPGRLLVAEDEFFKAIGYRQELNALAYRQASREGLKGAAFTSRVAELVENPTKAMQARARENAEYQTFTKPLGPTGQAIQQFANSHPLVKVVIPFIRTPVNIVKFAGERTPLAVFSKEVRADLSGKNGKIAQDMQAARIALGTMVGIATYSLAAEGFITGGGPKDPAQRAVMYLNGWQPYSVRVGDFYYSFGRLEPLGTLLGVAADVYEVQKAMDDPKEAERIGALVFASITKNLVDKTWLRGPAELIEAVSDPVRYGDRYIQRLAGSVVPSAVASIAREEDPYLKDARTLVDGIKARVPGLSGDVLPRRDIWGEPIRLEGSLGPDFASPIYERRVSLDPVNRELLALQIWPAALDREIRGVKLTPEQYDEYQRVAGRLAKYQLDRMVAMEGWDQVPAFARIDAIKKTISQSREKARAYMMVRHPQIMRDVVDRRIKEISPVDKD